MRFIQDNEVDYYANLISERFHNYPENAYLLNGISEERRKEIIKIQMTLNIKAYMKHDCVYVLNNKEGILISIKRPEISELKNRFLYLMTLRKLSKHVTKEELNIISDNAEKMKGVDNFYWYKKMKIKRPVHITCIATSKEAKGTGAFRKLFQGYIDKVKKTNPNDPVILETHTKENVQIYEHFGFELVKVLESDELDLKQYCMMLK